METESNSNSHPANSAAASTTTTASILGMDDEALPSNRFSLELEFVQALASPNYLHFLAATKSETGDCLLLQEPEFQDFLKYLKATWTQPEYELLIEKPSVVKEWTLPQFRDFCHQQQFLTWQHRHAELYGKGTHEPPPPMEAGDAEAGKTEGETEAS